LTKMC